MPASRSSRHRAVRSAHFLLRGRMNCECGDSFLPGFQVGWGIEGLRGYGTLDAVALGHQLHRHVGGVSPTGRVRRLHRNQHRLWRQRSRSLPIQTKMKSCSPASSIGTASRPPSLSRAISHAEKARAYRPISRSGWAREQRRRWLGARVFRSVECSWKRPCAWTTTRLSRSS